jgi:hypothetical protein
MASWLHDEGLFHNMGYLYEDAGRIRVVKPIYYSSWLGGKGSVAGGGTYDCNARRDLE